MTIPWLLTPPLILWALWRPLTAAVSPRFKVAYPHLVMKLRLAIGLVPVSLVIIYLWLPAMIWLIGAATAVFIVLERWRARPLWGQRRCLPPGSLELFPDTWSDDQFFLRQASKYGPVFKTSNFLRPQACVVGLETGIQLHREHGGNLETPWLPFSDFVPGGMLRYMHEPEHSHYRAIFRRALAPKITREFETVFAQIIRKALHRMSAECANGRPAINPLPDLDQMMMELWLRLFFSIDRESSEAEQLLDLYPLIDIANPAGASAKQVREAVRRIREVVEQQLSTWQDPPPPCLLGAILEENPPDARDPVVIGNLIYMLTTTAADMSALLCWIFKMACDHPAWLEHIPADLPASSESSQAPFAERFVMETLRMRQSEFIYREVVRTFDFAGFRFSRGWLLRICVWESHQDPAVFTDPDCFNPDRFLNRSYTRGEYSPFGASSHACLAPFLVTRVAQLFLTELVDGFTLSSPKYTPPELASSRHWAPGNSFRIQIRPKA